MSRFRCALLGALVALTGCGESNSQAVNLQSDSIATGAMAYHPGTGQTSPQQSGAASHPGASQTAPVVTSATETNSSSANSGSITSGVSTVATPQSDPARAVDAGPAPQWNDLRGVFGLQSVAMTPEKQSRWAAVKGKQIEWTGEVGDVSTQFGLPGIEVEMDAESSLAEVFLRVHKDSAPVAQRLKKGDKITFSGTLVEWGTVAPVITLQDVRIFTPEELAKRDARRNADLLSAAQAARAREDATASAAAREEAAAKDKRAEEKAKQTRRENAANAKLDNARKNLKDKPKQARKWLNEIVADYPGTEAAKIAANLLRLKDD